MGTPVQSPRPDATDQYPQGPKKCDCGHAKYVHIHCFTGPCVRCSCQRYVKAVTR